MKKSNSKREKLIQKLKEIKMKNEKEIKQAGIALGSQPRLSFS